MPDPVAPLIGDALANDGAQHYRVGLLLTRQEAQICSNLAPDSSIRVALACLAGCWSLRV